MGPGWGLDGAWMPPAALILCAYLALSICFPRADSRFACLVPLITLLAIFPGAGEPGPTGETAASCSSSMVGHRAKGVHRRGAKQNMLCGACCTVCIPCVAHGVLCLAYSTHIAHINPPNVSTCGAGSAVPRALCECGPRLRHQRGAQDGARPCEACEAYEAWGAGHRLPATPHTAVTYLVCCEPRPRRLVVPLSRGHLTESGPSAPQVPCIPAYIRP